VVSVGLHDIERSRRAALAADVDQDQRVIAAHDLVGEVQAAGAEVHHVHTRGKLACCQHLGHLAPEAVVAQPGVPDPGHEDLPGPRRSVSHASSTSLAKKNKYRPVSRISSCPGSSLTVTPR